MFLPPKSHEFLTVIVSKNEAGKFTARAQYYNYITKKYKIAKIKLVAENYNILSRELRNTGLTKVSRQSDDKPSILEKWV
jgi:type II restriction/modification system DNA methylase subunit YeeA